MYACMHARAIVLLRNQPINQSEPSYLTSAPLLCSVHPSKYISINPDRDLHPPACLRLRRDIGERLGASSLRLDQKVASREKIHTYIHRCMHTYISRFLLATSAATLALCVPDLWHFKSLCCAKRHFPAVS